MMFRLVWIRHVGFRIQLYFLGNDSEAAFENTLRSGDILFYKRDQLNYELQKLMDAFKQRFLGSF